ncbi:MAG TPA: hypothetical protein ENK37_08735 [Oceanithermus profundus]|uniref:Uncharacterized protein n=1 Tax=Oceanithermus profundus TaxID=187137 RepID=A0A7C4ZHA1_9DEIN|nr:hypothetical protein [Oceanithermus profundus]
MPQTERLVVEALTEYASPFAAQNIVNRALRRAGLEPEGMDPEAWLRFVRGPLMAELRQIFPITEPTGTLRRLVKQLEDEAGAARPAPAAEPAPAAAAAKSTLILPRRPVDFSLPAEREQVANELAREEGVSGVLIQGPSYQEARLPGVGELAPILGVVHNLLQKRKPYKLFYSVFQGGQVLVRPLGPALVALVAKREANLGRLMHVLNSYEAKGGQP